MPLHLSVVAPDRSVVETTVASVIAPGVDGYFGVLQGHAPLIAALKPGLLEYLDGGGTRHYVHCGGGFAEVDGEKVTILADEAIPAHEIDVARAEELVEQARRVLRGESAEMTTVEARQQLEIALFRVKTARLAR